MAERISIKKQVRFEVFKRDKFTCQYCGKKAPDVVLNVDHIKPVANGGDNNIINLITSCFDCNNGKSSRELSDNSVIEKQRKQLELLQERREQIELMLEWKKSLASFDNDVLDMVMDYINSKIIPFTLNDTGRSTVSQLLKKFPADKVLDGIDEASIKYLQYNKDGLDQNSVELFITKIGGFIYIKGMPPVNQKLAYIKGIGKNRFAFWNAQKASIILNSYVKACRNYGWDDARILEDLDKEVIPLAKEANNWSAWKNTLESWIDDINKWDKDVPELNQADSGSQLQKTLPCEFCYIDDELVHLVSLNPKPGASEHHVAICKSCSELESSHRKDTEDDLLEQFRRRKFSYSHVSLIAYGFEKMNDFHISDVMASVISWAFQDDQIMADLREKYFAHLAKIREENEKHIDDLPF
jgi:5-methylcytosine-specific restriction endonuclease McrA